MGRSWGGDYQRPQRERPQRGEGKSCMVAVANFTACVYAVVWLWRNLARA